MKKLLDYKRNYGKKSKLNTILVLLFTGIILFGLTGQYSVASSADYAALKITLLNQNPDPATPGKYVELRFKVQKYGNDELSDVTFQLEPEYPLSFDNSDTPEKAIGDWKGYSKSDEYFTLFYKLLVAEDAVEDTYTIRVKYKTSSSENWVTNEFDVRVEDKYESKFVLGDIITSPTKLVSDTQEAQLDIDIDNIGDGDAENVVVELSLPEGFEPSYSYSDRDSIGSISSGNSETARFFFDINDDITSQVYEAQAIIRYKGADDEDNKYKAQTINFKIPVVRQPKFKIQSVVTTPEKISPGESVEIKLIVKNIGGKEAESVSIRAYKESSQPIDFDEKSDFIGNIKPEESGEAVLKLTIDKEAAKKDYFMDIEFRSIYSDEVLTQTERILISVTEGGNNIKNTIYFFSAVVILLIIIVSIYFYNRKK